MRAKLMFATKIFIAKEIIFSPTQRKKCREREREKKVNSLDFLEFSEQKKYQRVTNVNKFSSGSSISFLLLLLVGFQLLVLLLPVRCENGRKKIFFLRIENEKINMKWRTAEMCNHFAPTIPLNRIGCCRTWRYKVSGSVCIWIFWQGIFSPSSRFFKKAVQSLGWQIVFRSFVEDRPPSNFWTKLTTYSNYFQLAVTENRANVHMLFICIKIFADL